MEPAVVLDHVTKEFSVNLRGLRVRAVDDLSLTVPSGCVYALLGPNGGGKSTTLKLILGLLQPGRGRVWVGGHPAGSLEARRRIGFLPELPYFPRHLTGREVVTHHARLGGLARRGLASRVDEMIATVNLASAADRRIGTYSKGMLQRIGLAQALVHDPDLVILDEPAAGVDPVALAELTALLERLKRAGKTIVLTTHQLASVEGLCDRVALLYRGRLVLEGAVAELLGETGAASDLRVSGLGAADEAALGAWAAGRGATVTTLARERPRLEERLVTVLAREAREAVR